MSIIFSFELSNKANEVIPLFLKNYSPTNVFHHLN